MTDEYDTVQMRVRRTPTWAELTKLKIEQQLAQKKEVSYDEVISLLLVEHRQKQEVEQ